MAQAHDPGTDAIELPQRDHDEIRRLLSGLAASPAGTIPAGSHDPRGTTVEQLVICASKHEAIGRFGGRWAIDAFTTEHWVSVQHEPRDFPFG